MKVLLVEDELLVAMLTEDFLADLGHEVVALASCVADASSALEQHEPDFAILDVNLGLEHSFPVAKQLEEREIPYIFVTGYGAVGIVEPYRMHPVLAKPFAVHHLAAAIIAELSRVGMHHAGGRPEWERT